MEAAHYQSVIETCFPGFQVQSISFLAEGWGSTAWEVNGTHVFRFPKCPDIYAGLLKEIDLLPGLASALPLPVPQFDHVWRGGPIHQGPFVGYRKIPGVPMTARHPAHGGSANPARQLGSFLTALHRFPAALAGSASLDVTGAAGWRRYYEELYETVRRRVVPLLEAKSWEPMCRAWEAFLRDETNFEFAPALIHRDLSGEHILYDEQRGKITGLIDWEDAAIGDPVFDFTGLLDYGDPFVAKVFEAYEGPAERPALGRARFYKAIVPCYEVLFGLDTGLAEHVTAGLAGMRAVWS